MTHFIVTHQSIQWEIPFEHIKIGIGGYKPKNGVCAEYYIGEQLDQNHAFGGFRAALPLKMMSQNLNPNETILCSSYRMFLSKMFNDTWSHAQDFGNRHHIVTSETFLNNHENLILQELPAGIDLVICSPVVFPCSIIEQYTCHFLDDLLFAIGCAVRAGLINQNLAAKVLSGKVMIPFSFFGSKKSFRLDFVDRLLWSVNEFHEKYYIPRDGYQRRCIDFAFERVTAIALQQEIIERKLMVKSSTPIFISDSGGHIASM